MSTHKDKINALYQNKTSFTLVINKIKLFCLFVCLFPVWPGTISGVSVPNEETRNLCDMTTLNGLKFYPQHNLCKSELPFENLTSIKHAHTYIYIQYVYMVQTLYVGQAVH